MLTNANKEKLYRDMCKVFNIDYNNIIFKTIKSPESYIYGYCSTYFKYRILIEINWNRKCINEVILTICHEFIHYKQVISGKLCYYSGKLYFKDESFTMDDIRNLDYYNLPWEKEAFENQYDYYIKYVYEMDKDILRKFNSTTNWDKNFNNTIEDKKKKIKELCSRNIL